MPNVVGRSVGEARTILEGAGLVVSEVRSAAGAVISDDRAIVTEQTPGATAQVPAGQRVALQAEPRPPR
jgi:beta-lactam-binding protein with PASTA domain